MTPEKVIEVMNVGKRYRDHIVLDNVNFAVFRGEIVAILGSSGCGKSTLMRIMAGLESPTSGQVLVDGMEPGSRNIIRKAGILFQNNALFGSMTIGENIALPVSEYTRLGKKTVRKIVEMKLAMVGLADFQDYLPSEISGGMKKKAALARALALNPPTLFLDEPTSGLDPISSAEIDELILHINRTAGTTMVVVTHELDSVFKIAPRVIMLDKVRRGIIDEGDPEFLKHNSPHPFVRQFFNRQPRSEDIPAPAIPALTGPDEFR
ncbi:MAG: ATP-binding cassette domain-containing protein [Thermodesulfobacteriota bacterium]